MTFSIFSCFLHIQPVVFKPPDKAVILSGAPHRLSRDTALGGAESKDLGGALRSSMNAALDMQCASEID